MKKSIMILIFLCPVYYLCGQVLKTFNGPFNVEINAKADASYTYFENEDTREYIKQGQFKFSLTGAGDYQGYDQTISGNFNKGLRDGTWLFSQKLTDFKRGNEYLTGTIKLIANYKDGYADGSWKNVTSFKIRKLNWVYGKGKYEWGQFGPQKTITIVMNFKQGKLSGEVNIDDEFDGLRVKGTYDANSLCTGDWMIENRTEGKNKVLNYVDNILVGYVARGNNNSTVEGMGDYETDHNWLVKAKKMSVLERIEEGYKIDTICGKYCNATSHIVNYFFKLYSNPNFNYDGIGGDLSFKTLDFAGGCELIINRNNYIDLLDYEPYKLTEKYILQNDLLNAYKYFSKIDSNNIKPSQRIVLRKKFSFIIPIISEKINEFKTNERFFQNFEIKQYDSLMLDQSIFSSRLYLLIPSYESYHYTLKPWESKDWESAKKFFEKPKFFSPAAYYITREYFKFIKILNNEIATKNNTIIYDYKFKNENNTFFTYDRQTYLNNISKGKKEYNLAKSLIEPSAKIAQNCQQIIELNKMNDNRVLFPLFLDIYKKYYECIILMPDIQDAVHKMNNLSLVFDKIISLYQHHDKEIERNLKKAQTEEEINLILQR